MAKTTTMGVIVGNRVASDIWRKPVARRCFARLPAGMEVVAPTPRRRSRSRGNTGRIPEVRELENRDRIDGIIVTLPNFGEERAIADTLRLANLRVPVLIQATPTIPRDDDCISARQLCGKMSACNNLRQYGIPYPITTLHTEAPIAGVREGPAMVRGPYAEDLNGCRNLRVGAIARPAAFNTVRTAKRFWKLTELDADVRSLGSPRTHQSDERQ